MELMNPPAFVNAPKAGAGARIGAYLIDVLVTVPLALIPIVGWIAIPAYILLRDALPFLDGQSLGKRLVGIRAVDANGASLNGNYEKSLVRNILLLFGITFLVELIVLLANKDSQRLGDQWAKTRVVVVK